jgi:hypothetical protein
MSEEERIDPGGNTEQWRAFAHGSDPVEPKKRPVGTIVIGVVIVVVILGGLLYLAFM